MLNPRMMAYEPKYGDIEVACPKCGTKRFVKKNLSGLFNTCINCLNKFNEDMCRFSGHEFEYEGFKLDKCMRCHKKRN